MPIVDYCLGVRSERRWCEEVHLNLAYRWFCRLGLDGDVSDHSTFSKNRNGRFRDSDVLRKLFETVVARCMREGLVGGEAFAVDASLIVADAHRRAGWPRSRSSTRPRIARSPGIWRSSTMRPSAGRRQSRRTRFRPPPGGLTSPPEAARPHFAASKSAPVVNRRRRLGGFSTQSARSGRRSLGDARPADQLWRTSDAGSQLSEFDLQKSGLKQRQSWLRNQLSCDLWRARQHARRPRPPSNTCIYARSHDLIDP